MLVYKLTGCRLDSRYNSLNFRYCACSKQGPPRISGNFWMWIYSETRTWPDNIIQLNASHNNYSQHGSIFFSILTKWSSVRLETECYVLESWYSHLKFRYCDLVEQGVPRQSGNYGACFNQRVLWDPGNYGMWVHAETRTWYDKIMQSNAPHR